MDNIIIKRSLFGTAILFTTVVPNLRYVRKIKE